MTQVEFPVALIDRNLDKKPPEARAAAEAFVQYCFTPAAQREFAACGFRRALTARQRAIATSIAVRTLYSRCEACGADNFKAVPATQVDRENRAGGVRAAACEADVDGGAETRRLELGAGQVRTP